MWTLNVILGMEVCNQSRNVKNCIVYFTCKFSYDGEFEELVLYSLFNWDVADLRE